MGVGLVGGTRVEQARPRRERRRHVEDDLAGGNQLLGQQRARSRRCLDRPGARLEGRRPRQEPLALMAVGTDTQLGEQLLVAVQHCRGVGPLVGVDSDDEHAQPPRLAQWEHHDGQS